MTATTRISPEHARQQLVDHPHYRYRGCAPDPDQPARAAGNPALSLDAWEGSDFDGAEGQRERRQRQDAAVEVCVECPVMTACLTYARTHRIETRADGTQKPVLAAPTGVMGGMTALERHREFIKAQQHLITETADARLRTAQKLKLLAALAQQTGPKDVAAAAGMDTRTANWHRSALTTLLGLDKATATRRELLAAAVARNLLDAGQVIDDDGTVPAVARSTTLRRSRTTATQGAELPASARPLPSRPGPSRPGRPRRLRVLRPRAVHAVDGQLELDLNLDRAQGPGATVHALPLPAPALGAAA